ncbi:MAG: hypothetical protein ACP5KW_12330, partial [Thermoproteota archaeon]
SELYKEIETKEKLRDTAYKLYRFGFDLGELCMLLEAYAEGKETRRSPWLTFDFFAKTSFRDVLRLFKERGKEQSDIIKEAKTWLDIMEKEMEQDKFKEAKDSCWALHDSIFNAILYEL